MDTAQGQPGERENHRELRRQRGPAISSRAAKTQGRHGETEAPRGTRHQPTKVKQCGQGKPGQRHPNLKRCFHFFSRYANLNSPGLQTPLSCLPNLFPVTHSAHLRHTHYQHQPYVAIVSSHELVSPSMPDHIFLSLTIFGPFEAIAHSSDFVIQAPHPTLHAGKPFPFLPSAALTILCLRPSYASIWTSPPWACSYVLL